MYSSNLSSSPTTQRRGLALSITALIAAGLLLTSPELAARGYHQDGKMGKKEMRHKVKLTLKHLDTDGNGSISLEEFSANGAEIFSLADRNQNRSLSQAEFEEVPQIRQQQMKLRLMDSNGDGEVDEKEFSAVSKKNGRHKGAKGKDRWMMHGVSAWLMHPNKNRDKAAREQKRAEVFAMADRDNDGVLDRQELAGMRQVRVQYRFSQLDSNGDGKLSMDEYRQPMAEAFALRDRDDNGELEKSEITAAIQEAAAKMKKWGGKHKSRRHRG